MAVGGTLLRCTRRKIDVAAGVCDQAKGGPTTKNLQARGASKSRHCKIHSLPARACIEKLVGAVFVRLLEAGPRSSVAASVS